MTIVGRTVRGILCASILLLVSFLLPHFWVRPSGAMAGEVVADEKLPATTIKGAEMLSLLGDDSYAGLSMLATSVPTVKIVLHEVVLRDRPETLELVVERGNVTKVVILARESSSSAACSQPSHGSAATSLPDSVAQWRGRALPKVIGDIRELRRGAMEVYTSAWLAAKDSGRIPFQEICLVGREGRFLSLVGTGEVASMEPSTSPLKLFAQLEDRLGRTPTSEELAKASQLPEQRVFASLAAEWAKATGGVVEVKSLSSTGSERVLRVRQRTGKQIDAKFSLTRFPSDEKKIVRVCYIIQASVVPRGKGEERRDAIVGSDRSRPTTRPTAAGE